MAFTIPRYNKCCFCIPLKIGVLIIGYISIVASSLTLAAASWAAWRVAAFAQRPAQAQPAAPAPAHPPAQAHADVERAALGLYISLGYYLLVFLFSLVISVILVIGVHMNKTRYMRIYFKATLFLFALGIALVVVTCVFMGFLATVPVLKWCFTLLVCLIIVRSYYLQLEEEEKHPPMQEMQPYTAVQQDPLML